MHVAVDDRSRYAYAEALPDERGVTTAAFLERAIVCFADLSVQVERVSTDNGVNYLSRAFRETAAAHGAGLWRTRPTLTSASWPGSRRTARCRRRRGLACLYLRSL